MSTLTDRQNWIQKGTAGSGSTVSRITASIDHILETAIPEVAAELSNKLARNNAVKVVALSNFYDGNTPLDSTSDQYSEAGYGTCIVIHDYPEAADGSTHTCLVFDLGNDAPTANGYTGNAGRGSTLRRYLSDAGITVIDALFISHYHGDHYHAHALNNLYLNGYTIKNVVLPHKNIRRSSSFTGDYVGRGAELAGYESITTPTHTNYIGGIIGSLSEIKQPDTENTIYTYGDTTKFTVSCHNVSASKFEAGGYYDWCYNENYNVRHADGTHPSCNYNNFSMINVVEVSGKKIVITGDIMAPAIEANMDVLSSSDIIFVPHHGLDCFTAPSAVHHLSAKYAVINSAYDGINIGEGDTPSIVDGDDGPGHLTRISRGFAAELLKHGCIVVNTYAGYTAEQFNQSGWKKNNVIFTVTQDNVVLNQTPSYAGSGLLPQAIQPYSEYIPQDDDGNGGTIARYTSYEGTPENCGDFDSADAFVRSLPFGEYITLFDKHAEAFKDALPFKYEGRKFKLIVEPASFRGKGKTQIAYHIGTSAHPEILMRTENTERAVAESWTAWRSFKTTDAKLTVVAPDNDGNATAISETALENFLDERMAILANNDPDEFVFKLSNIGDFEDGSLANLPSNPIARALDWTWTATLNKTGADWAILTAHCGFANGTVIRKRCVPKTATGVNATGHVWQDFEFENPPLYSGFEFRTAERYCASPVYTKLIELNDDTDGLADDHLSFTTNLPSGAKLLRVESSMNGIPVTEIYNDAGAISVIFPSSATASGVDSFVRLWYYKPRVDLNN